MPEPTEDDYRKAVEFYEKVLIGAFSDLYPWKSIPYSIVSDKFYRGRVIDELAKVFAGRHLNEKP